MTKAQFRTLTRELLDDPNAVRWGDTNLDLLIEGVSDEVWREVLRAAPWANSALETLTSAEITAPGYVDLTTLSSRWFKLQLVTRGSRHYTKTNPRNVLIEDGDTVTAPYYTYTFYGGQLWLFPLDAAADIEVRYSYLPPRFSTLADGTAVTWPDGFESVLYLKAAARALAKGGTEDRRDLWGEAENEMQRMVATMAERFSAPPATIWLPGSAVEWGSE